MRIATEWWPVVVLAIGIGVIGCEAQEAEDTDVEADVDTTAMSKDTVSPEQRLENLAREYERAYGERDAPALSALHTEDYLEISPEGDVRTATMLDSILQDTSQMGEGLGIETESIVVAESGDIAYGTGVTTLRGTDPEGEAFTAESRWLAGFEKVDGEWKLDRLMTSTPIPVETTPTPGAAGPPSEATPPAEDDTGGS